MNKQELKTLDRDPIVAGVGNTVDYVSTHRSQVFKLVGALLLGIFLATAGWWYYQSRQAERQAALDAALRRYEGVVGAAEPFRVNFPSAEAKRKDNTQAFTEIINKYNGTNEAAIAHFYLGVLAADTGDLAKAEQEYRQAAADGNKESASIAKLSLADTLAAAGKNADAEKVLRDLIANPTALVSADQATISLAKLKADTNPAEARKLLEPLRSKSGAIGRVAVTMLSELPAK